MERGTISILVQQLMSQAPVLVVCLAGFVVAILFIGRSRAPALLAMLGTGILLASVIGTALLLAVFMPLSNDPEWGGERFARVMSMIGIAGAIVRALGLAAILAAVFIGREPSYPEPA